MHIARVATFGLFAILLTPFFAYAGNADCTAGDYSCSYPTKKEVNTNGAMQTIICMQGKSCNQTTNGAIVQGKCTAQNVCTATATKEGDKTKALTDPKDVKAQAGKSASDSATTDASDNGSSSTKGGSMNGGSGTSPTGTAEVQGATGSQAGATPVGAGRSGACEYCDDAYAGGDAGEKVIQSQARAAQAAGDPNVGYANTSSNGGISGGTPVLKGDASAISNLKQIQSLGSISNNPAVSGSARGCTYCDDSFAGTGINQKPILITGDRTFIQSAKAALSELAGWDYQASRQQGLFTSFFSDGQASWAPSNTSGFGSSGGNPVTISQGSVNGVTGNVTSAPVTGNTSAVVFGGTQTNVPGTVIANGPPAALSPAQKSAWLAEYDRAKSICGSVSNCEAFAQQKANVAIQQTGAEAATNGYLNNTCDGFGSCAIQVAQGAWSKTTSFAQGLWDGISPDSVAGNAGEQQSIDRQENGDAPLGGEQKFLSGADGIAVASGDGLLPTASLKGNVSFYTPGAGGDNGGLLGNKGEYLPDNPDIAARLGSTYKQNEVLVVQRLDEGGHPVGDPRAVRIADSGYHPGRVLDLQRSVAEEIGFDMEKGVEKMQITSYGVASSPKSAQAMVDTLNSSFTGYELGSLDQPAATDNLVGLDTFPTNAPIADRIAATRQESIDLVTAAAPQVAPVSYDTPLPATSIPSPVLADVSPRFDSSYDAFNDARAALPEVLVDRTSASAAMKIASDVTSSSMPRALTDVGPSPDVLQLTHLEPTKTDAPFASLRSPSYVLSGGFTAAFSGHDVMEGGNFDYSDIAGGAGPGTTLGGVSTSEMYSDEGSITTNHPVSVLNTAENTGSNAVPRLGGFERDQILYPDTDGEYGALDPKVIDPNGLIKVTDASPYDALPQYSSYGAQLDVRYQELADKADRAEARASEVRAAEARSVASNARSERSNGPLEGQGEAAPRWVFFNYSPLGNSEYLYPNPSPSPLGGQMSQAGSWTQIPSNTPSPFISQSEGDAFPVTPGSQTLGASYEQAVRSAEVPLSGTLDPQKSIPETVLGTDNSTGYTSTGPIDAKTIPTVDQAKAAEELAKMQVAGDTTKEAPFSTEETKNPSAGRTERTEQLIGSGPGQLGQFGPGVTSLWGDNADFGTAPEREPVSPFIRVIPGEDQGVLSFGPSNDGAPAIAGVDANSADISLPKGLNDEVALGPKAYYPTIQESEGVGEGEASRAPDAVSAPPAGTSEASKQGIVNQPTPGQTAGIKGANGAQSGESGKAAVTGLGATPPAGAGPTAAPVVPPAGASPGARTGSGDPSGGKDTQGDKGGAGDIAGMLKSVMDMAKGLMGGGGGKGSGGGAPAPTTPVTANPATVLATPVPSTQFAAAVALTAAPKILVVANPNPVVSGTASTISWQAQWDDVQASSTTRECAVADVRGKTLADHVGVSDSIATPALTRAAYFVIGCKQSGGKLGSTMILIKVAGDSVAAEAPPKSLPRYETTSGLSTAGADLAAALYGSTASTGSVPASNTAEPQQQAKNMACDPNSQQYFECLTTKMQYVDKLY